MKENEKLSARQQRAITALLIEPTIRDAAKQCGVGETTIWRWMQSEAFQRRYRAARRQVVERSIGELQAATGEAVKALTRNLACGQPAVEVRAAQVILDQAVKAVELMDLEERIARLEEVASAAPMRKAV